MLLSSPLILFSSWLGFFGNLSQTKRQTFLFPIIFSSFLFDNFLTFFLLLLAPKSFSFLVLFSSSSFKTFCKFNSPINKSRQLDGFTSLQCEVSRSTEANSRLVSMLCYFNVRPVLEKAFHKNLFVRPELSRWFALALDRFGFSFHKCEAADTTCNFVLPFSECH